MLVYHPGYLDRDCGDKGGTWADRTSPHVNLQDRTHQHSEASNLVRALRHWGRNGPTDLGNLVLLCSYHHQFVHEHGWTIRGNPMAELDFIRPDGRVYGTGPPPLRPTTHNQLFGQVA